MSEDTTKTNGNAEASVPANEIVEPKGETVATKGDEAKPDAAAAENARLRDQLLRTAADFDNFRKRARREQDDAQKRGKQEVVKDLLPVFDNLARAVQHAEQAADAKTVAEGVGMVIKQFESTLERMGIKRVATVGTPFDPAFHEAIQHIESPEQPAGVVLHEVQAGYTFGDGLLRAAMVVVSKGPAKGEPLPS